MSKSSKYAVKFGNNCNNIMIGFSAKSINKIGNNNESCGYYLYLNGTGVLYAQNGDKNKSFSTGLTSNTGETYGGYYNKKKKNNYFL